MKRLLAIVTSGLMVLSFGAFVFATPTAAQVPKESVCQGIDASGGGCTATADDTTINDTITTAINILSFLVGLAAVIMIIIGGFKYITAGGDSNGISSAKNTIMFAIVGLLIVAFAQVIVQFVLEKAPATGGTSPEATKSTTPEPTGVR